MKLLDAAGPTEEAPAEAVTDDAPPDPGEVIKVFEEAKGNLDILVDVVTNLDRSFLEAKPFSAGRRPGVKREDAVANSLQSRVAATSAALVRVSRRLAEGAAALQAHVDREDKFYCQLRQLQMFWKVHLNPRVIDCPFMVDLSITEPLASSGGAAAAPQDAAAAAAAAAGGPAAGAGGAAAAAAAAAASSVATGQALTGNSYELGSGGLLVPLMKDEAGALRVQLEMPEERPDVNDASRAGSTRLNGKGARTLLVGGSRRVHALLLQLQRRQLWRQVAASLEKDAAALGLAAAGAGGGGAGGGVGGGAAALAAASGGGGGGGGAHHVHVSLARLASQNVLITPDPSLAALRPLMLEHLLACRLPPAFKPPPPPPRPRPGHLTSLAAATSAASQAALAAAAGRAAPGGGGAAGSGSGGGSPAPGLVSGLPLLPDLAALLNQMVFRDHQRYHLDLEAHALPYVTLRWRPAAPSLLTSAMEVRVGPSHRVLVVVRDGRTDVEGVVAPSGPPAAGSGAGGSRWVRDTVMAFTRHDVPAVLRSLLQTLGLPLDKLLGVTVPANFAPHHHGYSHGALAALAGGGGGGAAVAGTGAGVAGAGAGAAAADGGGAAGGLAPGAGGALGHGHGHHHSHPNLRVSVGGAGAGGAAGGGGAGGGGGGGGFGMVGSAHLAPHHWLPGSDSPPSIAWVRAAQQSGPAQPLPKHEPGPAA
ncbi:hypothetical protein HXX76_012386 [Chlamydomonas incerta]|uniref:Uncharacterized protein n=1 Tax=Chlamydomonas incerta TaxID=51695 RepID=A0A835VTP9_CHLIN|nr:hypothetical protein HXX76_012386 [Chlamydomonas incerta]|eukprot:KAG2427450.1 hypothetical protein HXX76_012386 [Chlamydomonas incerta]